MSFTGFTWGFWGEKVGPWFNQEFLKKKKEFHIAFSCHGLWISFSLKLFLYLFCSLMTWTFFLNPSQLLWRRFLSLDLSDCCLVIRLRLSISARRLHRWCWVLLSVSLRGSHGGHCVPLLVTLRLITWLRWCLPAFSTMMVPLWLGN